MRHVGGRYAGTSPAREPLGDASSHSVEEFERKRAVEILETARNQVGSAGTGLDLELHCLIAPSVARGLHTLAEAQDADLIVLGSSRRSGLDRVAVGDDTRAGLNGAPGISRRCAHGRRPIRPTDSHDRCRLQRIA